MSKKRSDSKKLDVYKVVLVGSSNAGKSNLLAILMGNAFSGAVASTIGVEFATKTLKLDTGKKVKAQVWDTAGQERYSKMMGGYYRNANGFVLCYDATSSESFESVERWRNNVLDNLGEEKYAKAKVVLVGCKADLLKDGDTVHEQIKAKAKAYAKEHGFLFAESSAKKDINVKKVFKMVVSEIHAAHLKQYERHRDSVMLKNGVKPKDGGAKGGGACAGCGT